MKAMLTLFPGRVQCDEKKQHNKLLAILGSFCFFLSAIEYIIPKPLPFLRIGLANLPLLLALDFFRPKDFFLLTLLKVIGHGIIGGTLFSYIFLFSFVSSFSSAAIMLFLHRLAGKKILGFAGLGCAGAMVSNYSQLFLAKFIIFGDALRYIMPPFLASGFITGIALGIICELFCRYSLWYSSCMGKASSESMQNASKEADFLNKKKCYDTLPNFSSKKKASPFYLRQSQRWNNFFNAQELFIAGMIMTAIFLFTGQLENRILLLLFFFVLFIFSGKKMNILLVLTMMSVIVFFNMLLPYGKVLAVIGPLSITQGSLFSGINKALSLEALVIMSRTFVSGGLRLPGKIGFLLGEALAMLELLREKKGKIQKGRIIAGIDAIFMEMEGLNENTSCNAEFCKEKKPQASHVKSITVLCAIIILAAAIAFFPFPSFFK